MRLLKIFLASVILTELGNTVPAEPEGGGTETLPPKGENGNPRSPSGNLLAVAANRIGE